LWSERTVIILAATLGFFGSAIAAETPNMQQCNAGWKADYSKIWSEAQFTKACDAINGKM
jgi:hypothetical protein